jgi:Helix-turn-helix
MKQDAEVLVMLRERAKGRTQEQAAARAGMSVRTARAYERRARLPSQLKQPRTYRSRPNPFAEDWALIAKLLEVIQRCKARRCSACCASASLDAIRRGSCAPCSGTLLPGVRSTVRTER